MQHFHILMVSHIPNPWYDYVRYHNLHTQISDVLVRAGDVLQYPQATQRTRFTLVQLVTT
jgi:hypothetical protein